MKKMKYLRTWLVAALLVTIIGSLTGGTVAWFTDSVESTGNVIESGKLDVDILLLRNGEWISLEKNPQTKVFDYNLWEPGYTQVETLKIVNNGNLALEYILKVVPGADEKKSTTGKSLAEAIDVYMSFGVQEPKSITEIKTSNAWWKAGSDSTATLANLIEDGFTKGIMLPSNATEADNGLLETGLMQGECICTVALHMQEEAGNEFQGLSLGTLGFCLEAKQAMYETDSFNTNEYDKDATFVQLPPAKVTPMSDTEKGNLILNSFDGFAPNDVPASLKNADGTIDLDYGMTFEALESTDDLVGKPYEKWHADFVVRTNKEITAADYANGAVPLVLVGNYGDYGWVPVAVTMDVEADKDYRLLASVTGIDNAFTYNDVLSFVQTFKCGIKADPAWATAGTTITVELKVWETNAEGNEVAEYSIAAASYTY